MITSLHHIGCIVPNILEAVEDYFILHPSGEASEIYTIEEQKVKVCFFTIGATNIELVEPAADNTTLLQYLDKQPGYYHIGLYTTDLNAELQRLEANGYRIISRFRSPAFSNRWCAFMHNLEGHLVELIEVE